MNTIKSMLGAFAICLVWPAIVGVQATEIFVSSAGNDSHPGTREQPYRTIQHAADATQPGDIVLIRGGVYRERVFIRTSGEPDRPITFRRYGNEDVQVWFSKDVSAAADWTEVGGNRWRTADGSFALSVNHDVATIWHDDRSNWRYKKRRPEDLHLQWDFWHDLEHGRLEVYSADNPAHIAKHIEVPLDPPDLNQFVVTVAASHIDMDGISIKYANVHGIQVTGNYVTFRNGRITHGGGGNINPNRKPPVRWGDGLDIWSSAHDVIFENNVVGEFPDGGLTNQGFRGIQYNIFFRNNTIYNCTNGIHCWFGEKDTDDNQLHHIYYEGNTFRDIGCGWFEDQGVMQGAIQFNPRKGVATREIHIRGNTFIHCGTTRFSGGTWQGVNGAINIGGGDVHITGNRIYGGPSEGIHIHHNGQPWTGTIVNNLIYGNRWSGLRIYQDATTDKARICQNTIVNNGDQTHANVSVENRSRTTFWRNNIFCSDVSKPLVFKTGNFDFNCCDPGPAPGANSLVADPRFVSPHDNNYQLLPDSPCRDAGDPKAAATCDFTGRARPVGAAPDMGAYEVAAEKEH